jgi:hypothetical protein
MSDIIRHGTIIIDLKAGKVELPAPQLSQVLDQKKQEAEVQKTANAQVDAAKTKVDELAKAQQRQAQEAKRAADEMKRFGFANTAAYRQGVEGAFQLMRAMTLLGAQSEESLGRMIKDLAAVQAGSDLFKGSTNVIKGFGVAFGFAESSVAGFLAKLNPVLAVVSGLASAYALWSSRTREQAEAQKKLAEEMQKVREEAAARWLDEYQRSQQLDIEEANAFTKVGILARRFDREQREANYARAHGVDPDIQLRHDNEAREALLELQQARRELFQEIKEVGKSLREWTQGISEGFGLFERKQSTLERVVRDALRR